MTTIRDAYMQPLYDARNEISQFWLDNGQNLNSKQVADLLELNERKVELQLELERANLETICANGKSIRHNLMLKFSLEEVAKIAKTVTMPATDLVGIQNKIRELNTIVWETSLAEMENEA